MSDINEEIKFCDECISHLCENAGPDHIAVKYREALVELKNARDRMKMLKEHGYIDATPDGHYAMRILQNYREMCNVQWSDVLDMAPTNLLCIEMNRINDQRKAELDKALNRLEGSAGE